MTIQKEQFYFLNEPFWRQEIPVVAKHGFMDFCIIPNGTQYNIVKWDRRKQEYDFVLCIENVSSFIEYIPTKDDWNNKLWKANNDIHSTMGRVMNSYLKTGVYPDNHMMSYQEEIEEFTRILWFITCINFAEKALKLYPNLHTDYKLYEQARLQTYTSYSDKNTRYNITL